MTSVLLGERTLIERIRMGDEASFNEVYSHYYPNVYVFSYRFLKSKELAQECTQLTFLKIWEGRESLNCELSFKSYLFTICKNILLKTIATLARENKFKLLLQNESRHHSREDGTRTEELEQLAQQALAQLPAQRQLVFKLCRIEGQSYDQAAERLGVSKGTVRDHLFKAGKTIRAYLSVYKALPGWLVASSFSHFFY